MINSEQAMATVIMPVYNGEKYLEEAIESILNQTFKSFKFIIINDGSTDNSDNIIRRYNDERIIYKINNDNLGLIETLNIGINMVNTKYIIRMDADDVSLPDRFEKQIKFMEINPEYAVSGTEMMTLINDKIGKRIKVLSTPYEIKSSLLFRTTLMHPTIIMRSDIFINGLYKYEEMYYSVEDHALWFKISKDYKIGNLNEVLLHYRIHPNSIMRKNDKNIVRREKAHNLIYKNALRELNLYYNAEEIEIIGDFINGRLYLRKKDIKKTAAILRSIGYSINKNGYSMATYSNIIKDSFITSNFKAKNRIGLLLIDYNNEFKDLFKINILDLLKYIVKGMILRL